VIGSARKVIEVGESVTPRMASSLVLVRDGVDPERGGRRLEVLMIHRQQGNVFAPGVMAFPGGAVEEADRRFPPRLLGYSGTYLPEDGKLPTGGTVLEKLVAEGLSPDDALAVLVAGLRETFEETRILPDCISAGEGALPTGSLELVRARTLLRSRKVSFQEILEALGATVDLSRVRYLAHWITPEGMPTRYDTRFFLVPCSFREALDCEREEICSYAWVNPREALERCRQGEFPMLPPTVAVLSSIAGCADLSSALTETAGREVRAVCPRLVERDGELVLEIPPDAG
jgi:8-oxo-dGTP pyrophosphatase MutT (NUDIX family)